MYVASLRLRGVDGVFDCVGWVEGVEGVEGGA